MTTSHYARIKANYDTFHQKMQEAVGEGYEVQVLRESYANLVRDLLAFEDQDWLPISGVSPTEQKGFCLADFQPGSGNGDGLVRHLEKQTKTLGDLLGRGLRLKNNHVFGKGYRFEKADGKIAPRFQAIIDDPVNQAAIFAPTAVKRLNRIVFTSGNLLVRYDRKTKKFSRLSIDVNIENFLSDDRDPAKLKYLLVKWTERNDLTTAGGAKVETKYEWVPTSTYDATKPAYPKTIGYQNKRIPVNTDSVIIFKPFNNDEGETWGVPDAFAASAPAAVYARYMRSGAMLQEALAAISFVVKARTQAAAQSAGAKLQKGRVAQAAITGPETEIQSMPRAGSIDLYEGRPLVARVASALDVSTTGLTADPGPGGSYASENALSQPELMSALSRQEDFSDFFAEVFRVIGDPGIRINYARLDSDPIHRQMQSLGLARTLGGINQEEFRLRALEVLDIEPTTTDLPKPDVWTGSNAATLEKWLKKSLNDDPDPDTSAGDPVASQGNSGAVGSLDDSGGNSARNDDAASAQN